MEELLKIYSRIAHKNNHTLNQESSALRLYLVNPLSAGIFGFAVFFFFIIIFEALAHLAGFTPVFKIGITEIAISCIGFFLQVIINLMSLQNE